MIEEININFLNAENGDSIVIEFVSDSSKYIVIDSNLVKQDTGTICPAYEYLKTKNASTISALIVSHLHEDHYNGIENILNNFAIKKIVIPPFLSTKSKVYNKIIDSYKRKIKETVERCSDDDILQYCKSLIHLIHYISKNDNKIEEAAGKESVLRFPDIDGLISIVYLPLRKTKGVIHHLINNNDYDLNSFPQMNDSSIAMCLDYHGKKILLTGDSTLAQWQEHKRQMSWDNISNLDVNFLKVPHHGSKYDNKESNYKYFFNFNKNGKERYVFVSANGVKHPDKELFSLIDKLKLIPFCTNLSKYCLPPNVIRFKPMPDIPQSMRPFLRNYAEEMPTECQGDILLNINENSVNISSSKATPCPYRPSI